MTRCVCTWAPWDCAKKGDPYLPHGTYKNIVERHVACPVHGDDQRPAYPSPVWDLPTIGAVPEVTP